jgi:hypothetical protein
MNQKHIKNPYEHFLLGTPQITVPEYVVIFNKHHEPLLIQTLTKTGKLTTRNKIPSINLISSGNEIKILNKGETPKKHHLELVGNYKDIMKKEVKLRDLEDKLRRYRNPERIREAKQEITILDNQINKEKKEFQSRYDKYIESEKSEDPVNGYLLDEKIKLNKNLKMTKNESSKKKILDQIQRIEEERQRQLDIIYKKEEEQKKMDDFFE